MSREGSSTRSVAGHLAAVLALATRPQPVRVPVAEAVGRVLAEDARAVLPVPPFSNSAMDGFLVRSADLSGEGPWVLPVVGDVPAGRPAVGVPAGAAVRIMTGAPVGDPVAEGLRVIPVEDTSVPAGPVELPGEITVHRVRRDRHHVRLLGENTGPGDVVVPAGRRVDAGTLAALISIGLDEVVVFPSPRVAVLSSGDELVGSGRWPGTGQIPDSNGPMMSTLLRQAGAGQVRGLHAGDSPGEFTEALREAASWADLVVTSGGISAGAFDVVREVTDGGGMWFGPVAQKPGAPQGMGCWSGVPLLCLPGNPVSVFVSHQLYVVPLLRAMAGLPVSADPLDRPRVRAEATVGFPAPHDRHLFIPVRLGWSGEVPSATPFTRRGVGSHMVASLSDTDGLAVLAPGAPAPGPGQPVTVLLT